MGAKLTTFENRSNVVLEIRVFRPPARPDRFRRIIRIKPGDKDDMSMIDLCYGAGETNPERAEIIMVFVDGVYAGISMVPLDLVKYSKVICDRSYENGPVVVRGVRSTRLVHHWRRIINWGCCYFPGKKYYCGRGGHTSFLGAYYH